MNGTLSQDIYYNQQYQGQKQPAQPITNHNYSNNTQNQKYTNPPDHLHDTWETRGTQDTGSGQSSALKPSQQQRQMSRKQRAQLLRQRAGLGKQNQSKKIDSYHSKWGNFLVFYDSSKFSVTLGPDYWCFIPTFVCFSIISIAVLMLLFNNTESLAVRLSGILVCGGQLLSYILIATSNPGVAQQQKQILSLQEYPTKLCKKCGFSVPRSCYHCRDCDVCIVGYDHHCPWTSKCIGQNNLGRFYLFLAMTPIFLVYIAVAFVMVMSQQQQLSRRQQIQKL